TQRYRSILPSDISRFQSRGPILIQGTVISNPAEEKSRALIQLETIIEPISIRPVSGNLLLVFKDGSVPLYYGDRIRARVVVEKPTAENNFDYPAYLARQRIYAVAYPKNADLSVFGTEKLSRILSFSFKLRARLKNKLARAVPEEPQASILEAMSFGLRQPKAVVKEPFRKIGTYHLLVVSGFNVAFFLLFLHLILSPFPLHPRLRALCCLPAIFLFTLACGLAAPVVRAGLMAGFYYLGKVLNRPSKAIYALCFAAFLLLLVNPFSLLDAGWQLTFGITLGLIVGADRIKGYFPTLPNWLATSLSAGIIGQLASIPLVAFHFGSIQVLGIFANLFFVPFSALRHRRSHFRSGRSFSFHRLLLPYPVHIRTAFYFLNNPNGQILLFSWLYTPGGFVDFRAEKRSVEDKKIKNEPQSSRRPQRGLEKRSELEGNNDYRF
ncbi:MAG: ComEC/Rec2 family competence protein, partial [Candidatus Omnitrophica bacterium]|nr:ComEC/Rec2 family competence protein [Candidatus Omnitrophota bacterium]